jgi:hypothetical protein
VVLAQPTAEDARATTMQKRSGPARPQPCIRASGALACRKFRARARCYGVRVPRVWHTKCATDRTREGGKTEREGATGRGARGEGPRVARAPERSFLSCCLARGARPPLSRQRSGLVDSTRRFRRRETTRVKASSRDANFR